MLKILTRHHLRRQAFTNIFYFTDNTLFNKFQLKVINTTGHFSETYSTSVKRMNTFKFSDYDCIGFDLDNTLLRYNITNLVLLEYDVLSNFLIKRKNYNPKYLGQPLGDKEFDFIQKGLMLDFEKGNILRVTPDGIIQAASHGSKKLTLKEIKDIYPNKRWEVSDIFVKDMLATWNGPLSLKIRSLLDYFDMPASIAFARIVDTLDEENGKPLNTYSIWPDVLEGLQSMFERENFALNKGDYFPKMKASPQKYLHICHPEIINWIKKIREKSKVFLLTGSNIDFADFTASYTLGNDWKTLFDIVICYSKKPGFFTDNRPFYELEGYKENKIITGDELKQGNVYSQGNWKELTEFIARISGINNPKCLYIGDNIIQDIYVPKTYGNCDTIAVVDEQLSEKMFHHDLSHLDEEIINSSYWGSYFTLKNEENTTDSLWNHIIKSYAKLCVPQLDVFVKNPLDKCYECFSQYDKNSCGYYPAKPLTAL